MEVEFSKNRPQAIMAAKRYERIVPAADRHSGYDRVNLVMDLMAADAVNGNDPIDWDKLLGFDDFNFLHDVAGISRHMNRETGGLTDFFRPRCTSASQAA